VSFEIWANVRVLYEGFILDSFLLSCLFFRGVVAIWFSRRRRYVLCFFWCVFCWRFVLLIWLWSAQFCKLIRFASFGGKFGFIACSGKRKCDRCYHILYSKREREGGRSSGSDPWQLILMHQVQHHWHSYVTHIYVPQLSSYVCWRIALTSYGIHPVCRSIIHSMIPWIWLYIWDCGIAHTDRAGRWDAMNVHHDKCERPVMYVCKYKLRLELVTRSAWNYWSGETFGRVYAPVRLYSFPSQCIPIRLPECPFESPILTGEWVVGGRWGMSRYFFSLAMWVGMSVCSLFSCFLLKLHFLHFPLLSSSRINHYCCYFCLI
jgi:hypothetical protein